MLQASKSKFNKIQNVETNLEDKTMTITKRKGLLLSLILVLAVALMVSVFFTRQATQAFAYSGDMQSESKVYSRATID